jgi:hypothetical protein
LYNESSDLKFGGESMRNVLKICYKFLSISVILFVMYCAFSNYIVCADSTSDDFNPYEYDPTSTTSEGDTKLLAIGNDIIGQIQLIGSVVSVIAIIIIGIRYMLGSVEEKAQYKETMTPYLIGAVLVFGITNVLAIVSELAKSI